MLRRPEARRDRRQGRTQFLTLRPGPALESGRAIATTPMILPTPPHPSPEGFARMPMKRSAREVYEGFGSGTSPNLHRIWRGVGCPLQKSPANWMQLASDLLAGMAAYQTNLVHISLMGETDEAIRNECLYEAAKVTSSYTHEMEHQKAELDRDNPSMAHICGRDTQVGDTMTIHEVAVLYCMYLDDEGWSETPDDSAEPEGPEGNGGNRIIGFLPRKK
jgi:hypothetical protein